MIQKEHGGDVYRNQIKYDFSINVNPLGLPEAVMKALRDSIPAWSAYPDPECEALKNALSAGLDCPARNLICGNGAADLIYHLVQAVRPKTALVAAPTFSEYARALCTVNCEIRSFCLKPEDDFALDAGAFARRITPETDMVFLCNPNNPNGLLVKEADILAIAAACEKNGALFVLDECFIELSGDSREEDYGYLKERPRSCVTLRAFTKSYAMAGLRLGYMMIRDEKLCDGIRTHMQPWSVSLPAQIAGAAALQEKDYLEKARRLIKEERDWLSGQLKNLGYKVFPSDANYILFCTDREDLLEKLLRQHILIRDCSNYEGLKEGYYRICVKTRAENEILVRHMRAL